MAADEGIVAFLLGEKLIRCLVCLDEIPVGRPDSKLACERWGFRDEDGWILRAGGGFEIDGENRSLIRVFGNQEATTIGGRHLPRGGIHFRSQGFPYSPLQPLLMEQESAGDQCDEHSGRAADSHPAPVRSGIRQKNQERHHSDPSRRREIAAYEELIEGPDRGWASGHQEKARAALLVTRRPDEPPERSHQREARSKGKLAKVFHQVPRPPAWLRSPPCLQGAACDGDPVERRVPCQGTP